MASLGSVARAVRAGVCMSIGLGDVNCAVRLDASDAYSIFFTATGHVELRLVREGAVVELRPAVNERRSGTLGIQEGLTLSDLMAMELQCSRGESGLATYTLGREESGSIARLPPCKWVRLVPSEDDATQFVVPTPAPVPSKTPILNLDQMLGLEPGEGTEIVPAEEVTVLEVAPLADRGPRVLAAGSLAVFPSKGRTPGVPEVRLSHLAMLVSLSPEAGSVVVLPDDEPLYIGSEPSAGEYFLALPERGVSRRHACIVRARGGYYIRDLESTNRTVVNGRRVTEFLLRSGDEIMILSHRFAFVAPLPPDQLEIVDLEELRIELARTVPAEDIRMVLRDVRMPVEEVRAGSATQMWFDVLELCVSRKRDYDGLRLLLRTLTDRGYRSAVFQRALGRLDGVFEQDLRRSKGLRR